MSDSTKVKSIGVARVVKTQNAAPGSEPHVDLSFKEAAERWRQDLHH